MKRFIFVSDIHGEYNKLLSALYKINFDKERDVLVSVGDAFDRGKQNSQVLTFLMSLPNKILIWGNHDIRLYELINKQKFISWIDEPNGTLGTLKEFGETINIYDAIENIYNNKAPMSILLKKYFEECVFCIEFKNLYACHAWLPNKYFETHDLNSITKQEWFDTSWVNSLERIPTLKEIDKPLLIGHFHSFRIAEKAFNESRFSDNDDLIDTSTFISPDKKLICIDGCTTIKNGQVNTYIYTTNENPIIYKER